MSELSSFPSLLSSAATYTALAVFAATYLFIAVGKLPGYPLDCADDPVRDFLALTAGNMPLSDE